MKVFNAEFIFATNFYLFKDDRLAPETYRVVQSSVILMYQYTIRQLSGSSTFRSFTVSLEQRDIIKLQAFDIKIAHGYFPDVDYNSSL